MIDNHKNPRRFTDAAAHGLRVFPMNIADGAPPVNWTEYEDRAPTPDELAAWDATHFNVGVICGKSSDIVVMMVDDSVDDDMLPRFPLPATPWLRAGSERHFYFRAPAVDVGRSISIGPCRFVAYGDCSTVVGPGSVAPSGVTYDWVVSPAEVEFAELPEHWVADLRDESNNTYGDSAVLGRLSESTRDRVFNHLIGECSIAIADLKASPESERRSLFELRAGHIRWAAAAGASDWHVCEELLKGAALEVGLEPHATAEALKKMGTFNLYFEEHPLALAVRWIFEPEENCFSRRESLSIDEFNAQFGSEVKDGDMANLLLSQGLIDRISPCCACGSS